MIEILSDIRSWVSWTPKSDLSGTTKCDYICSNDCNAPNAQKCCEYFHDIGFINEADTLESSSIWIY